MKRFIKTLALVATLFIAFDVKAQGSTSYHFKGNIFTQDQEGKEQRFPFLPVTLSKQESPDQVVAVAISNGIGEFSFQGVPIDISKDYIFTITLPSGTYRFLQEKLINPSFKSGNINTHIRLDKLEDYQTQRTLKPTAEQANALALDFVTSAIEGATREGLTISNAEGLSYQLLLNGIEIKRKVVLEALKQQVTAKEFKEFQIFLPKVENDYSAGTINLIAEGLPEPSFQPTKFHLKRLP